MARPAGKWATQFDADSDEDDREIRPLGKSRESNRDRDRERDRDADRPRGRTGSRHGSAHSSDESDDDRRRGSTQNRNSAPRKGEDFEEEIVTTRVKTSSRQPTRGDPARGGAFVPKTALPYDRPPKPRPAFSEEPDVSGRERERRDQDQNRNSNSSNPVANSSEWSKGGRRENADFYEEERQQPTRKSNQSWVKSGGWVDAPDAQTDSRDSSRRGGRDAPRDDDRRKDDGRRSRDDLRGSRESSEVRRSLDGEDGRRRDDLRGSRDTSEVRRLESGSRDPDDDRRPPRRHRQLDDNDRGHDPRDRRDTDRDRDNRRPRREADDRDRDRTRSRDYERGSRDASESRGRSDSDRPRKSDRRGRQEESSGSSQEVTPRLGETDREQRDGPRRNSEAGGVPIVANHNHGRQLSPDGQTDTSHTPDTQSSTGLEGAFRKVWNPAAQQVEEDVEDPTAEKPGPGGQAKPSFVLVAHPRGVRHQHIQCTVVRDRNSMQGKLYPQYELILEEPRRTLIVARKMSMNRTSNYHLFDMTRGQAGSKLSKKAGNYLGKLRAKNSQRTEYSLLNMKADREEIGAVSFDRITLLGQLKEGNQPRKMKVILPMPDPVVGTVEGVNAAAYGLESLSDLLQEVSDRKRALPDGLVVAETKEPVLENGNYRLNFFGRVNLPSVKNFQIVHAANIDNILCQFGKVDEDVFHLDFKSPFTAVQAFALALCQFNL